MTATSLLPATYHWNHFIFKITCIDVSIYMIYYYDDESKINLSALFTCQHSTWFHCSENKSNQKIHLNLCSIFGLVQDSSISIPNALEILQHCIKQAIYDYANNCHTPKGQWDYKNPLHLDVVDRYLDDRGIKRFLTKLFYPPWVEGIDLPQSRGCGFFVSLTNKKECFKVKTQQHLPLMGCFTITIQIRKWGLVAHIEMVMPWWLFGMQNNVCHPVRLISHQYTKNTKIQ